MTLEQISDRCIQNSKDIAALAESMKSAHKRIDENDRMTESVHRLASSIEVLTQQVSSLIRSVEKQGERIGALEKEPAAKWKTLVSQVIAIVVAGLVGGALSNFIR